MARRPTTGKTLLEAAQRMVAQIETLVTEISELRADNESLRAELRDAVALLHRASAALGGTGGRRRRVRADSATSADAASGGRGARRATGARRTSRAAKPGPAKVKLPVDVVRAAVGMIGPATAAEIAGYLGKNAGLSVSGRAVRWVAEAAGVQVEEGPDGRRRYRL